MDEGRLIVRDEVLDAHSLHMAISSFDVLVCNIAKHQWSSDMALRAMVAGTPILASDEEWFRHMDDEFRIGTTIPSPRSVGNVASHIVKSLASSVKHVPDPKSAEIIAFNQPENYAATVLAIVTDTYRLG